MKRGLVIGKFYPFHKGHAYLIDTARARSEQVFVLVCDHVDQTIPGQVRAEWIRSVYPDTVVQVIPDTVPSDDSVGWARHTIAHLGFAPDLVFTSEGYGDAYARAMGSTHVLVDRDRIRISVSATNIREDVWAHADYLHPHVRAFFVRRVAVVGAESTGTTTLAQDLAREFRTVWVPEVGRYYSEGKRHSPAKDVWEESELSWIGQAQADLEDALAPRAQRVLVADTDPFATELWHERLVGGGNPAVRAVSVSRSYDLYLLTDATIPFVQDGTREGGEARQRMHRRFVEELRTRGLPHLLITGSREARLRAAAQVVERLLTRPFGWSRSNRCPGAWYCLQPR